MSYLDELKKKGQQFVQNVQKAADTANNVYNAAKQGAQNAYNAATGNTQQKPQTQAPNTQPSPAAQPQNAQPAQAQPEVDWAAEYDKAMTSPTTPTTGSQPGGQAAQPPTSAAAQSALGEGAGQWQAELDNVMAQIMGKGKFEYDMNGDAMYQQYADIYQNQANLGMQNAMAQAAALTGGYGSSYAQQVGQQAYAQQMQGLNEIGLELYDRAYAQDQAERSQLMDQYNMLYNKHRDEVADDQWNKQFNRQAEEFDSLYGYTDENGEYHKGYYEKESDKDREQDQSQFDSLYGYTDEDGNHVEGYYDRTREDEQAYHQGIHNDLYGYTDENGEYHKGYYEKESDKDREQDQSQFDSLYGYTDEDGNKVSGYYEDMADKEFNQMYGPEGYMTKKGKQDQENWDAQFKREGEQWNELYGENGLYNKTEPTEVTYNGGGTLQGQNVPTQLQNIPGLTTTDTSWFDENGNFKKAEFQGETTDGKMSYRINGKTVTYDKGVNPYTETYNKDCKNGTFSNGYQPNNVNGSKLSKTGEQEYVNGVLQNVWKDEDGNTWVWDGTQNKYIDV